MHTGGCAVNTAIDLSKIGEEVGIIALVGTDGFGEFIKNELKKERVNIDGLKFTSNTANSSSIVLSNSDGEPTARTLKRAQELGKYTILDTAWDSTGRWMRAIRSCMPYIDLFIPSIQEAQMISGKQDEKEIAEDFLKLGAKNVVIKLGSKGCYVKNKDIDFYVDANGAFCVMKVGASSGIKSKEEILAFVKKNKCESK